MVVVVYRVWPASTDTGVCYRPERIDSAGGSFGSNVRRCTRSPSDTCKWNCTRGVGPSRFRCND